MPVSVFLADINSHRNHLCKCLNVVTIVKAVKELQKFATTKNARQQKYLKIKK